MPFKITLALCFALVSAICWCQCPDGEKPVGEELVINGDFSAGNTGFSSDYFYSATSLFSEAYYGVTDNAKKLHSDFSGTDHTSGSGNFMVVNGSSRQNTSVWCQTIKVSPNKTYVFSTWLTSVVSTRPAILQFSINGKNLGDTFNAPAVNTWKQFQTTWYSGTAASATICIVNQNRAAFGNDFGLDDISFRACGCNMSVFAGNDTTICQGSSIQLNGKGGKTYQWKPDKWLTNDTIANPIISPLETTTYWLFTRDDSCADSAKIVVTVNDKVQAIVNQPDTICLGETVQLIAGGGNEYKWFPATGLTDANIPDPVANPSKTTSYKVVVKNGICSDSAFVTVHVLDHSKIIKQEKYTICEGNSLKLLVSGGKKYKWIPSEGLSSDSIADPIASPVKSTLYKSLIYNGKCPDTAFFDVTVNPLPKIKIVTDTFICIGKTLGLQASGADDYLWSNGFTGDAITQTISEQTIIWVKGTSENCSATDTFKLTGKICDAEVSCLWIPNSFTPNDDKINDVFEYVYCELTEISQLIYNRWGEEIFRSSEVGKFWDGKFRGKIVENGAYLFLIKAMGKDKQQYYRQGIVNVLR